MKTKLDKILDSIHNATRRKFKLRRKHIIVASQVLSTMASTVSVFIPSLRPAALTLSKLQETIPLTTPQRTSVHIPPFELDLLSRIQILEAQIPNTTGEQRIRLEAQRDILLKLVENYEQRRQ